MKFVVIVSLCIALFSCKEHKQRDMKSVAYDSITVQKDTLITYDIDGISTEGAEAAVAYMGGQIRDAEISIYGERGKSWVAYIFNHDSIHVTEKHYSYTTDFAHVRTAKDIHLDTILNYTMDQEGKLPGAPVDGRIDIFEEFRKVVPLTLGGTSMNCESLMHRLLYSSSLPEDLKKLHFDYNIDEVRGDTVSIALTTYSDAIRQDVALHWVELDKQNKTLKDITGDPDKPVTLNFDKDLFEKVLKYCDLKN